MPLRVNSVFGIVENTLLVQDLPIVHFAQVLELSVLSTPVDDVSDKKINP